MAATRRILKELAEVREMEIRNLESLRVNEANVLTWLALIVPDDPPYNKGAFEFEINFPLDYPFRPPKLFFHTKIYHPNIDEQGYVCLPIIMSEFWRPSTRMSQVIMALIALVSNPDPHLALRSDAAEELLNDKRKFIITAEAFTIKNALPRPIDSPQSGVQLASQSNKKVKKRDEDDDEEDDADDDLISDKDRSKQDELIDDKYRIKQDEDSDEDCDEDSDEDTDEKVNRKSD